MADAKIPGLKIIARIFLCQLLLSLPVLCIGQGKPHLRFLGRWDNDSLKSIGGQTFNNLCGWASSDGREYAIIGTTDSIYFIEVTNPKKPTVRSAQAGRYNKCIHRDMKTYSHYAYCVADEGSSSLQIFDIKYLPDSVHKVYDSDSLVALAHNIYIEYPWIYFANPKNKTGPLSYAASALKIASIVNPELPVSVFTMKSNYENHFFAVYDLNVKNDTAFMSCGYDGMWIYDLINHTKPKLVSSITAYPESGYNHSSALSKDGKTLIFTDENPKLRIKRCDATNIRHGALVDTLFGMPTYKSGSIAHNPFVKGRYVFVSYYQDGVAVFDLEDSDKLVDSYDTYPENAPGVYNGFLGCWGVYPYLPSGTIIASDMSNGLFCLGFDTITGIENTFPLKDRISVFPNPIKDRFCIRFISGQEEKLQISIYNMEGTECYRESRVIQGIGQAHNFELPASMAKGFYILKISSGQENMFVKLVVE